MVSEDMKGKIKALFKKGYTYRTMHYLLLKNHGYNISFEYLQRKVIPSIGLRRRQLIIEDFNRIVNHAMMEIKNGLAGHEQLRRTLRGKYDIQVTRATLKALSEERVRDCGEGSIFQKNVYELSLVSYRKFIFKQGPDYLWHMDGYDKLSPFGLCIHGCIDGYSRKLLWLEVGCTNKRPAVVASYYVNALKQEGGFPRCIRGDRGTENIMVAEFQRTLTGENKGFIFGKSTSNQRIERFWGILRNQRSDFWMDHFKKLDGHEKDNEIHRMCLQYCYTPFIRKQLQELKDNFNCHLIRRQRQGDTVSGIPDILHSCPEILGATSYKTTIGEPEVNELITLCDNGYLQLDPNFVTIANDQMQTLQLTNTDQITDIQMCMETYTRLRDVITTILQG